MKHWLKEYPVNPVRVREERRKFIRRNKDNPSLVFAEDQTFPGTEFPLFQILDDKIVVPTLVENTKSRQQTGLSHSVNNKKLVNRLVPAKWDVHFQEAQAFIHRTKKLLRPELMKNKEFNAQIHRDNIRHLEKQNHYFEKSPSHFADQEGTKAAIEERKR